MSAENEKNHKRAYYGRLAGWVGIVCNMLLSAGKFIAGTFSGSVSITGGRSSTTSRTLLPASSALSDSSYPKSAPTLSTPTDTRGMSTYPGSLSRYSL